MKKTVIFNGPSTVLGARRDKLHRALDAALDRKRAKDKLHRALDAALDRKRAKDKVGSFSVAGELQASELAERLAKRGGPYTPSQERIMAKYGYGGKAKDADAPRYTEEIKTELARLNGKNPSELRQIAQAKSRLDYGGFKGADKQSLIWHILSEKYSEKTLSAVYDYLQGKAKDAGYQSSELGKATAEAAEKLEAWKQGDCSLKELLAAQAKRDALKSEAKDKDLQITYHMAPKPATPKPIMSVVQRAEELRKLKGKDAEAEVGYYKGCHITMYPSGLLRNESQGIHGTAYRYKVVTPDNQKQTFASEKEARKWVDSYADVPVKDSDAHKAFDAVKRVAKAFRRAKDAKDGFRPRETPALKKGYDSFLDAVKRLKEQKEAKAGGKDTDPAHKFVPTPGTSPLCNICSKRESHPVHKK